jgi:MFS transporter, FHS family, L-fucose permease
VGISEDTAGFWLQASLIVFLVSRFVMTYLLGIIRPTKLLLAMGALGVVFCLIAMLVTNTIGLIAVVAISLSLSLMFPTIYGVALRGLGEDTKFGAAGLVMAILGGALMPPLMGAVMDQWGTAQAFIVPGVCLAFVALYALFDLRTRRDSAPLVVEGSH